MPIRHHFIERTPSVMLFPSVDEALIKLFLLRGLCQLGGSSHVVGDDSFDDAGLAAFLDLKIPEDDYDKKKVLAQIKNKHAEAEKNEQQAWQLSPNLSANLKKLCKLVDLNELECRLLVFFALLDTESALAPIARHWVDDLSLQTTYSVLAVLLNTSKGDIAQALSPKGRLLRCGLVSITDGSTNSLGARFSLLSDSFTEQLFGQIDSAEDFLLGLVKPGKPATLVPKDYRHIQREYDILLCYLRETLAQNKVGVNVLIYGDPGTGKSELVRLLSQELGASLLEVQSENEQFRACLGEQRLRAFKAAQQFFSADRSMILFDEIQDVFDDGGFFTRSTAQLRKADINILLEENPLPSFWLSNNVYCMDAAFIRRFDVVIELGVPPMGRRQDILQQALGDLPVPMADIKRFSEHPNLSPAIVSRAANVVRTIYKQMPAAETPKLIESLFNQTLNAQEYSNIRKSAANGLPDYYDVSLVNTDIDLAKLAEGIRNNPSARICLYGPPGTGKSAFAQWLARELQKPFHNKKLSDILSMWVGGTERNLQKAFHEAEQENAVLLLDEVDSFLQDRRQAARSWELTQVNEMLTQMEAFNGLFIASTNLMDNLDQAALRRFDLKIHLGYLKPEKAWRLFTMQCEALALEVKPHLQSNVEGMTLLTPGDFAAVQRRHRFHPFVDAAALLDGLHDECAVKEDSKTRRIGFV